MVNYFVMFIGDVAAYMQIINKTYINVPSY